MTSFSDNLYKFVSDHIAQYGKSPAYAEITKAMNISPRSKSLVTRALRKLEHEKKVTLTKKGRYLEINLTNNGLPLLGKISAGEPIEAISDVQHICLEHITAGANRFALQVKGTSMIEEGIFDGDIIICRKMESAREGDIVVALIDQQNVTLKRISYKVKGMVTLIPANEKLKPRAYQPERISIQGIYIGLIRLTG